MDVRTVATTAAIGVGVVGGAVLLHRLAQDGDRPGGRDEQIIAPGPYRDSPLAPGAPDAERSAQLVLAAPPATVSVAAAAGSVPAAPAAARAEPAPGLIPVAVASVGPRGMEARGARFVHSVQPGQTLSSIARAYNETFPGMSVTYQQVHAANRDVIGPDANVIRAGQELRIPRVDAMAGRLMADNPSLTSVQGLLVHEVRRGDTLSKLARHYNDTFGLEMTWSDIHARNREYIGADPDRIRPGQMLAIPGVTKPASTGAPAAAGAGAVPPGTTLDSLHRRVLAERRAIVEHEDGTRADIPVMRYRFDATKAESAGRDYAAAVDMARRLFTHEPERAHSYGIVRDSAGEYWVGPLEGREADGLDDSTRTIQLRMERPNPALRAFVQPSFEQLWGA